MGKDVREAVILKKGGFEISCGGRGVRCTKTFYTLVG